MAHGINASPGDIRREARTWEDQSIAIGNVAGALEGLHLTRNQAGPFQGLFSSYEHILGFMTGRCTEGRVCMERIADRLYMNANAYDTGEQEITQHVKDAY